MRLNKKLEEPYKDLLYQALDADYVDYREVLENLLDYISDDEVKEFLENTTYSEFLEEDD